MSDASHEAGDLLIRGGTLVDGTGAPGRQADVRIRGGKIAEIAPKLASQGEGEIDATGAIVAPGFIDSHTHYDATIFWDPMLDPMSQHGVTSVVAGNCALGLAPVRAQDRLSQIDVFSFIEDLPADLLNAVIPWKWESFADYAKALGEVKLGVNLLSYVGHSQIRGWVMGAAAWERAATAQEIAAMVEELDKALAAGALGLSYSLFDKDRESRPVPSFHADDAEMDALIAVLGKQGATFQFVPGDTTDVIIGQLEWLGGFLARHKVVGLYNTLVHLDSDPERSHRLVASLEQLHAKGAKIYGMVSPRLFEIEISFLAGIGFINLPSWNELVNVPLEKKFALIADEAWLAKARHEVDTIPSIMFPFDRPDLLRIASVGSPEQEPWLGKTLEQLAADRGQPVADALIGWEMENGFRSTFVYAVANTDEAEMAQLLQSPVAFVSGSDAGAHLLMFCAAGDSTKLLTRYVRERGDMSLEAAIHALTGRQAEILGLRDRGVLAPGRAGDVTIFALDELSYGPEWRVKDVPGDRSRLTRDPGGYRYTIVDGIVVQDHGKATGMLPARWLAHQGQPISSQHEPAEVAAAK
jgi:N-acyl-D-aspartate/D-glutamate deacylase